MIVYEIQNNIPIKSKIKVYILKDFLGNEIYKDYMIDNEYVEGVLKLISTDMIRVSCAGKRDLRIDLNEIDKCILISYPPDYTKKVIYKEDRRKMENYLEEFDEYNASSFHVSGQAKNELLHMLDQIESKPDTAGKLKIKSFLEALLEGKEQMPAVTESFKNSGDILEQEWLNRLIVLQYLYGEKEMDYDDCYAAIDLLKSNIVLNEKAIDWFLMAVIYRKIDVKPKAVILYALKRYIQLSAVNFTGDNLKIVLSYCILYGDYSTIIKILSYESNDGEDTVLLAKGLICMLINDVYDRKQEAWEIHTQLESRIYDKLKEDIYQAASRIKDYSDDDILYRIDHVFQFLIGFLKDNPENITKNSCSFNTKMGYLFEYRTNSDTGYIMSHDFLPYFFHKNSLKNTRIISEFVDNFLEHSMEDFCVMYRKLNNTKKLQAGEIDTVLIG